MSAQEELNQAFAEDASESKPKSSRPAKEKKKRRRSRSRQKDVAEPQFFEQDYPYPVEDEGDNSCSSTPKYERNDEPCYPSSGLICALCYCGEKSLLGQGDLTRYSPTSGFNPFKKPPLRARGSRELLYGSSPGSNGSQEGYGGGEKVTKTAAVQRRGSKHMRDPGRETVKSVFKALDCVDELSTVGCSEGLEVAQVFELSGHVTAHHCCAAWSEGVTQNESYNLLCVDKAVHAGMSQRCHSCSRYGATIKCRAPKCERLFHYPCAAGSGCFQDIKSMSLLCTDHLELAPTIADPDELNCAVCDDPGQISDLLFCTSCGHHYHGDCLDPHVDVNPVVRAGWQCPECKICQTCRQPGDDNKMLVCDVCDKGYHTFCLRPAMTFIPKNGWCCKNCRRCTDCGSRTPGNGPSSRWHINYQVCDSCYQLRNKGSSCPVCGKAYRNLSSARVEMSLCNDCKKWVHWGCEESSHLEACQKSEEGYTCPRCRNPELPAAPDVAPSIDEPPAEGIGETSQLDVSTFSTPPPSESGGADQLEAEMEGVTEPEQDIKPPAPVTPLLPLQSPPPTARKRASTSSSISSDKASFALKGSSLDPMLCLGEDNSSDVGESTSLAKVSLGSPPRKVRHISSDGTPSGREKAERRSSAESNLSAIFTDENAQDTMSLFGVESLSHPGPTKALPQTAAIVLSPDAKSYKIPESFVLAGQQPKVSLSPLGSPQAYNSPPAKPPGPGMGKPGGMFGKGKPFGHKRRPAPARSRGKGKGKGQKRGSWSGARKRPGKGNGQTPPGDRAFSASGHRNIPRRPRGRFQRQCSTTSPVIESSPASPISKVEPAYQAPPADDEYGDSMHNTVVLCSTEDDFTLSQDMCVVCGSFGKGSEGRLITCSQCGQCYHPYCVNLKLTKVVLRKGWRCLDCTVCEECGQVDDPAHLLLCDDCDISYHTHCLRPPLQHVPKGGWKCKWCVRCIHCGTTSPGKNCEWASNYTSCGPCASLTHCPRCKRNYKDEDVIMQCGTCERWIHAVCECLFTESDIEKVLEKGYECVYCRPKDAVPPHIELGLQRENESMYENFPGNVYPGRTRSDVDTIKEYHKDYTALTMAGLQHIQKQMQKFIGHHKKRPAPQRRRGQKVDETKHHVPAIRSEVPVTPTQPTVTDGTTPPQQAESQLPAAAPGDSAAGTASGPLPVLQPPALPSATVVGAGDLSSATITATEDSGMESGVKMAEMGPAPQEGLQSPTESLPESKLTKVGDYPGESSIPESTASGLGIQQSSKKKRKPYRPGIGGFMVRQRGRGGGLLKPRSRRGPHHRAIPDKSAPTDTKSDTLASETTSDSTVPAPPAGPFSGTAPQEDTASAEEKPTTDGGVPSAQFKPGPPEPIASVVSPLKLKISTQTAHPKPRKKKRAKLIDQFPPYLQDAFFGKKIISDAKAKSNPLDNMDENPASPGSSYGPTHSNDSYLVLPDRLTQRLEAQAAAQAANLANQASSSHSEPKSSQRHPSQPQDEDAILNEQELLGVLPDFPFKDDEILGILSMKQEQGTSDPHENILSPSALEKMVANIDVDLFSDVLNNDTSTSKHDTSLEHSDNADRRQDIGSGQQQPIHKSGHSTMGDPQMPTQPHETSLTPSAMQPMAVSGQPQAEHPRQVLIQQEAQQVQMKQQQQFQQKQATQMQTQQMIQGMGSTVPSGGFCMSQPPHVLGRSMSVGPNMTQGRHVVGGTHQPNVGMMGHQTDRPLSRSHHGTPVMSPVPTMAGQPHALSHISPHQTPPPQTHFMRQASMPANLMPGLPSTGQGEIMMQQQMQNQSQISSGMARIPQSTTPPQKGTLQRPTFQSQSSLVDSRLAQPVNMPPRPLSNFAVEQASATPPQPPPHFQTSEIQHAAQFQSQPTQMHSAQQRFQPVLPAGAQGQRMQEDVFMSGKVVQQQQHPQMGTIQTAQASATHMHRPVPAPQQNVGPSLGTTQESQAVSQAAITTTIASASAPSTPTKLPSTPVSRQPDSGILSAQLPDFSGDSNLFEPSPRPWPLGTELEGDSLSVNQRNILKWEKDEPLGELATISPVLYANVKFKDLKKEFPDWPTRAKQVAKLWRKASSDERAPFLLKARDNRALLKANRARRCDDAPASKTPTPPIPSEDADQKPPTTQSVQVEAHVHSQLAQVQQLLQEFEQVSSRGQQIKAERSLEAGPLHEPSQQQTALRPTSVPSTSPSVFQPTPTAATEGAIATPLTKPHSFTKPISKPDSPKSPQIGKAAGLLPEYPAVVGQQLLSQEPTVAGQIKPPADSQPALSTAEGVGLVHAKIERHHSSDLSAQSTFPYPQSQTPIVPSVQDSPSKGLLPVTRSLSVGAQTAYPRSQTPRGKASEPSSSVLRPATVDQKNRRLSVDSQVTRMATPTDADIKPATTMSPSQTQIRQAMLRRRSRLWEQQSNPPPPYPAQTSPGGTQAFIYSHPIPRHQMMQMQGPRVGLLTPGTAGAQTILRTPSPSVHGPGMMAFPFDGSAQHGYPPGHLMSPPHGFSAGVIPVKGYKGTHPPGAYIELTHSTQSDPATRRQNILRMAACSSSPAASISGVSTASEVVVTSSQPKVSAQVTPAPSGTAEVKSEDPFMGGHMPQDEHLDALLRSDEFKDLHFQGAPKASSSETSGSGPAAVATVSLSVTSNMGVDTSAKSVAVTEVKASSSDPKAGSAASDATSGEVPVASETASALSASQDDKDSQSGPPAKKDAEKQQEDKEPDKDKVGDGRSEKDSQGTQGVTPVGKATEQKTVASVANATEQKTMATDDDASVVKQDATKLGQSEKDDSIKNDDSKNVVEAMDCTTPGTLKTDHSYSKTGQETAEKAVLDTPASVETKQAKSAEKPGLKVDVNKGASGSLRGVGLTPPPDSEVAAFVPSQETEPSADSTTTITVSNVITVPGTPPAGSKPPSLTIEEVGQASDSKEAATADASVVKDTEAKAEEAEADGKSTSGVLAVVGEAESEKKGKDIDGTESKPKKSEEPIKSQNPTEKSPSPPKVSEKLQLTIDIPTYSISSADGSTALTSLPKSPTTPPTSWRPLTKPKVVEPPPVIAHIAPAETTPKPAEPKTKPTPTTATTTLVDVPMSELPAKDSSTTVTEPVTKSQRQELAPEKEPTKKQTTIADKEEKQDAGSNQKQADDITSTKTGQDAAPVVTPSKEKLDSSTVSPHKDKTQQVSTHKAVDQKEKPSEKDTDMAATVQGSSPSVNLSPDADKVSETVKPVKDQEQTVETGTPTDTEQKKEAASSESIQANISKSAADQLEISTVSTPNKMPETVTQPSTSNKQKTDAPVVSETSVPQSIPSTSETASLSTPPHQIGTTSFTSPPPGPSTPATLPHVAGTPTALPQTPMTVHQAAPVTPTRLQQNVSPHPTSAAQSLLNQPVPGPSTGPTTPALPRPSLTPTLTSTSPSKQINVSPPKDELAKSTPTTPQRQKPLLIKEQPLLLQELLEEEKREQERARLEKLRHSSLLQPQVTVPAQGIPGVFPVPGVEMEKVAPEGGIDKIKMEFLSRINQAAQGGLPVVPPAAQVEGGVAVQGPSTLHSQSVAGRWPPHVPGPPLQQSVHWMSSDTEIRKYRNWLVQHHQVMQIQIPKQEQLVQTKKLRKQALMKKRNQCKRSGKEFMPDDAEELKVVAKQYTEAQQQLEKLRTDQKQHAELIQEFNIKQQRMMGVVGAGAPGAGGTLVAQQPQVASVMEGQVQQQIMVPQPGAPTGQPQQQHIIVPPFQAQGMQAGRIPTPGMSPQQQLVMMQQGQQQLIIKNVPAAQTDSTANVASSIASVAGRVQQQQQPQVVAGQQQQQLQQQALIAQIQNMPGMSTTGNPAQIHQLMINQHQLQQQQLQQQLKQKPQLQQTPKGPQPRPGFTPVQSSVPTSVQTAVTSAGGNPTHNAFMQMQMQQLMALQIEQQRAAFQQQPPEKPKPKRKRKKKKTQAEKEAEEQQQLLAQQQQQQQMQRMPIPGNLPVTGQPHPGTWFHRPVGMQAMQQHMRPQGMPQQRFGMVPGQPPMQMQRPPGVMQGMTSTVPSRFPGVTPTVATPSLGQPIESATPASASLRMMTQQAMPHSVQPQAFAQAMPPAATTPLQPQGPPMSSTPTASIPVPSTPASHVSIPPQGIPPTQIPSGPRPPIARAILTGAPVHQAIATTQSTESPIGQPSRVTPTMQATYANASMLPAATSVTSVMSPPNRPSLVQPAQVTPAQVATQKPTPPDAVQIPSGQSHMSVSATPTLPGAQVQKDHPSPMAVAFNQSATPPGIPTAATTSVSSAERAPLRIHSPGQGMPGFEGLSEAEIAILMENDPDLNEESQASTSASTIAAVTPPLASAELDDKNAKEETKKKKRPKKGYVMDQKTIETIDDSISNVIRLSVEYEDKKQAAKDQAGADATPTPWEIEAKPTKFPKKPIENMPFGGIEDAQGVPGMGSAQGNKELLRHLLKTGHAPPGVAMPEGMPMFGQLDPMFAMEGLPPGSIANLQYTQQQGMGLMTTPYMMQPSQEAEPAGQKKKRARRGSKETGPDGKVIKRRRKKDKNAPQTQVYQVAGEGSGMPGDPRFQVIQSVHPTGPFPQGVAAAGGNVQMAEQATVWKRLPLLALVEPEIRRTHHMCVPKGTGLTECRRLLSGRIGDSSYNGVPDLYEIYLGLEKPAETSPVPPTPPASLPPSPTHSQKQQQGQVTQMTAKTETTHSGASYPTSSPDKVSASIPGADTMGMAAPRPSPMDQTMVHPPLVKVPESLPTPPHHGIEDKDEAAMIRPFDNAVMPPSSPEMDEEDEWTPRGLNSLREDLTWSERQVSPLVKGERITDANMRDSSSPDLALMTFPQIKVPMDTGRRHSMLNDKDSVSVTIEFDNANIKSIEKSLTLLSRILDTPIISYSMMEMIKPDKKLKDALSRAIKEEQSAIIPAQNSQNQALKNQTPETEGMPRQRRCAYCTSVVSGNGVRKPQFQLSSLEEDVIYCNKDCYIKCELLEKKASPVSSKKKFKASHIYQRHTCKISMASLLEKFPEEDPLTPSKTTRSSVDADQVPAGVAGPARAPAGDKGRGRGRRRGLSNGAEDAKVSAKRWRGVKWKKWTVSMTVVKSNGKPPVDVEALIAKYGSALKPHPELIDRRICVFCGSRGDGDTHTIARLLNVDVDQWVHLNCALWSSEVYETQGGALINVDLALRRSETVLCCLCQKKGATIRCHRPRCINTYHCQCALDEKCVFFKDKTVLCPTHAPKPGMPMGASFTAHQHHHSGDTLRSLAVFRKVYVQRPETKQIASIMQQGELAQGEKNYMLRVGALIFENVGQLATHQMGVCHSKTAIYPIGYKATRIYWSSTNMRRRCRYQCTVTEVDGEPKFLMEYKAALPGKNKPDKVQTHTDAQTVMESSTVNDLWMDILKPLETLRSQHNVLKLFPDYINGEKLFGFTAPVVTRILESLPNIELCGEYKFRYGRTPLLEVPLAINPTGCARSEPHIKQHRKKPHTLISNLISEYYESSGIGDASSLYGKQFVHSKSSQYRKMKCEWRSNVYLARSRIQGLGLFSARDIEPGTMVIEYIGDIIRIEVSEKREKMYEATNRGVYMFRLDSDHIVDATVTGGPARYINHSCKPNCVAEVVNFEKEKKIMIVSNRHILKGEELSYDYKFDFEDEGRKIPCLCGASNCRKWMN